MDLSEKLKLKTMEANEFKSAMAFDRLETKADKWIKTDLSNRCASMRVCVAKSIKTT